MRTDPMTESIYMDQPEPIDLDACDLCGHEPCTCDAEFDMYRDSLIVDGAL